ncbi:unnamed protein product [Rhizophagus irregularis]|uniref:Uncharacterized protein n=1 Tax=Rhizophagus irregularis TaxID=588596 RepID=A0A915Z528_9GLOM|nr:unnamed protein product [Rhizophagus irregularis]CAB5180362.1 unnamed protein product [Rhizophagus irregularis]CAB5363050.1 unnamed protein product [Rhizophagus irregularis]
MRLLSPSYLIKSFKEKSLPYYYHKVISTRAAIDDLCLPLEFNMHDFIKSEDLHKEVSEQIRVKYLLNSTQELDEDTKLKENLLVIIIDLLV